MDTVARFPIAMLKAARARARARVRSPPLSDTRAMGSQALRFRAEVDSVTRFDDFACDAATAR